MPGYRQRQIFTYHLILSSKYNCFIILPNSIHGFPFRFFFFSSLSRRSGVSGNPFKFR